MKRILFFFVISFLVVLAPHLAMGQASDSFYLFVGTYTSGESEGIYVYNFDAETGEAKYISKASGVDNPSYLAISPDENFVYAVNETGGEKGGAVSAFSFDKAEGALTFLNKTSSGGGHPCYVSVDQTGRWAFAGNYSGGSLAMLPIAGNGSLQVAEAYFEHSGSSINKKRQERPHVHCTYVAPDNEHVLVADLGTDQVKSYRFNASKGELTPLESGVYEAEPGSGPRHITFHPEGNFAYLVNELNGTIDAFTFEAGKLNKIQQVSTLPDNYDGAVSGADIHLSPDGKFLYASNREDLNNIVIYSVNQENGQLSYVGEEGSGGIHPRNFMIDPTGEYLLAANRNTDNVVVFKRDKESGMLTKTGNELEISMPVCLKMMPVD